MKLCIRAHDLGVKGTKAILDRLNVLDLDGVQMVAYKAYPDVPYDRGGITVEKAAQIGRAFADAGKCIPMIGAYFNPVHSNSEKRERCRDVFAEYLAVARAMGSNAVGSETGSYNDDKWTYHPSNRTPEALQIVADTFSGLCDAAAEHHVNVAMEGAAGHCCWNPAVLDDVQKSMNKENLQVIFDLYNYLDETNQEQYLQILEEGLERFAGRILLFHMKDCEFVPGEKPRQVPFGKGQMNLNTILKKIKNYDPEAVLVLEGTAGEDIADAVRAIRTIWERV